MSIVPLLLAVTGNRTHPRCTSIVHLTGEGHDLTPGLDPPKQGSHSSSRFYSSYTPVQNRGLPVFNRGLPVFDPPKTGRPKHMKSPNSDFSSLCPRPSSTKTRNPLVQTLCVLDLGDWVSMSRWTSAGSCPFLQRDRNVKSLSKGIGHCATIYLFSGSLY